MIFWILVAVLAALVTFWVTRPLLRTDTTVALSSAADIAVYKDQLAEIDADLARNQINAAEAEAAKSEVSRRLIRLPGTEAVKPEESSGSKRTGVILAITTLAVPLLSLGLYLTYGNPGLPGAPLADRLAKAPDKASTNDLIAKVEAHLRNAPDDGKGWDVIAPVYSSQGRFIDSAEAYANAIRILGETPHRLEGMAVADIRGANGIVSKKARAALERAKTMAPERLEPMLWLALAKEQDGDIKGAVADYQSLLSKAGPDVPWRGVVSARLAQLEGGGAPSQGGENRSNPGAAAPNSGVSSSESPAPPNQQGRASESIASLPAEQRAMIDQMVAGLAQRLKTNGNDLEGWLKLMRALKVLGRDKEAASAFSDARKQFSGDGKSLEAIDGLAKTLGLGT